MNNNVKGYLYELQIKNHILNNLKKEAFLWNDVPENLLIDNGIIASHNENRIRRKNNKINNLSDTGVDIVFIDDNNKLSFVQCKNGYSNGITFKDLSGISLWTIAYYNLINKSYVYYTDKISNNLTLFPFGDSNKFIFVKQPFCNDFENNSNTDSLSDTNSISDSNTITNTNSKKFIPLDYQLDAKKAFDEYYKNNSRGILSMPCGTGKTFTSFLISKKFKQIVIISPLKEFAYQNLQRYIEYGFDSDRTLLIDSDGCRDKKKIKKFITSLDI